MANAYEPREHPIARQRARAIFLKAIEEQAADVVTSLAKEPFSAFCAAGLDRGFRDAQTGRREELKQLYERFGKNAAYMNETLPSDSISIEWHLRLMRLWDEMWPPSNKTRNGPSTVTGVSVEMFAQMERVKAALEHWADPLYLNVDWMLRVSFETLCWWASWEDKPGGSFAPLGTTWDLCAFEPFLFPRLRSNNGEPAAICRTSESSS